MIWSALGEGAVIHKTCKRGFRDFVMVILTVPIQKNLISRKNSKKIRTGATPDCMRSLSYSANNFPLLLFWSFYIKRLNPTKKAPNYRLLLKSIRLTVLFQLNISSLVRMIFYKNLK